MPRILWMHISLARMAIRDLKEEMSRLPEQPGVYLYFNRNGETIYVGRARILKDRVRSYLTAHGQSPKTDALLAEVEKLEIIVTDSLEEALALESNLIKHRSPRYNILLRDDKNYPYLQLTTNEQFPRVLVSRQVSRDGNYYAGPFLPASFARKTMSLTHRLFGIRSCNEVITGNRDRPCLEYDIKRCIAPCVKEICDEQEYATAVENTRLFFEGRTGEVLRGLKRQMHKASSEQRYEQAAIYRDAINTIETFRDRQQKMATTRLGDRDAFGVRLGAAGVVVQVFQVRRGRVVERIELVGEEIDNEAEDGMLLQTAVQQFYSVRDVPPEIHVPVELSEREATERWLSSRAGRRVRLLTPRRGEKRGLLDLAIRNASFAYDSRFGEDALVRHSAVSELQQELGLGVLPRRIECFDISTIQGSDTVGAMVVCEDGQLQRSQYRKYRIRGLHPRVESNSRATKRSSREKKKLPPGRNADDFASMHEVVLRRYRRLLESGGPFPDLVLVDGGKGQLSAAYDAFEQLGLGNLVAVGIAKKEEELFVKGSSASIRLVARSAALQLVQRIRNETHRVAVSFHRRARKMRDMRSELDLVPGIGLKRRKALLSRFGSLANVRRATREELEPVVGRRLADVVIQHFATMTGRS